MQFTGKDSIACICGCGCIWLSCHFWLKYIWFICFRVFLKYVYVLYMLFVSVVTVTVVFVVVLFVVLLVYLVRTLYRNRATVCPVLFGVSSASGHLLK